jgi:hypothetical protein
MNDALLRLGLILIAAITALSGLTQLIAPGFVLDIIAGNSAPPTAHLFATVGLFMLITGAMFLQSLVFRSNEPSIPFWIGVQKITAAMLVSLGVVKGLFVPVALGVALLDALSGLLAFLFWKRLPR